MITVLVKGEPPLNSYPEFFGLDYGKYDMADSIAPPIDELKAYHEGSERPANALTDPK